MLIRWTEIEAFHNIRKYVKSYPENLKGNNVVSYRGKCKIHGTNGAIQCHKDGTVVAQSRECELSQSKDNCGFARWVSENEDSWKLKNDLVIFGEWCGSGVQPGVAISSIGKKVFAVFAARSLIDPDLLIVEPEELEKIVKGINDVFVLPWHDKADIKIDWSKSAEELEVDIKPINELVLEVEANDPWVDSVFHIKGIGEGIVYYPVSPEHLGYTNYSALCFKAKGGKHRVVLAKEAAQISPDVISNIKQFVDMFLTIPRLEQGAAFVNTESFDNKLIGKFIAWIIKDVEKESKAELEASSLEWKQVSKAVGDRARVWYLEKLKLL